MVDSQGCALSQGGVDTGGGTGEDTGDGTSEESSETDDSSIPTMFMTGCIAIIALLALFSRMAASEPAGRASAVSASQNEYKQAQRLQKTLGSTMQENDGLRREREQLTRLLRSSDLTDAENRNLRNELSTMQSVMGENDEMAREMVAELEELRGALAEERAAAKEASAEYQDSVHQGDNVGQKVESQTINDADAIARIALESYKQALRDMGKEDLGEGLDHQPLDRRLVVRLPLCLPSVFDHLRQLAKVAYPSYEEQPGSKGVKKPHAPISEKHAVPPHYAEEQPNPVDQSIGAWRVQIEKRSGCTLLHRVLSLRGELLGGLLVHRLSGRGRGRRIRGSCVVVVVNHIARADVSARDVLGDAVLDPGALLMGSWRGLRSPSDWPRRASGVATSTWCGLRHTQPGRRLHS